MGAMLSSHCRSEAGKHLDWCRRACALDWLWQRKAASRVQRIPHIHHLRDCRLHGPGIDCVTLNATLLQSLWFARQLDRWWFSLKIIWYWISVAGNNQDGQRSGDQSASAGVHILGWLLVARLPAVWDAHRRPAVPRRDDSSEMRGYRGRASENTGLPRPSYSGPCFQVSG